MPSTSPSVIVLAGPNGAGKTTTSRRVLRDTLEIVEFVNADVIAQGLSGFLPESAALEAGRIMLLRLHELAMSRATFAFETTLASRSFAPWLKTLVAGGYDFHLFYFWLPSPEMAIQRVAQRVRMGGHFVADATVRRRYHRGLSNLFRLYLPISATWALYDNSIPPPDNIIASGAGRVAQLVNRTALWNELKAQYDS